MSAAADWRVPAGLCAAAAAAAAASACLSSRREEDISPPPPRKVRFGPGGGELVEFGPGCALQPLRSSAAVFAAGDSAQLRANFARDGYIYLPQALPREAVLAAKQHVLEDFGRRGGVLDASRPIEEAVLKEGCAAGCVPFLEGQNDVTHDPKMLAVLEGSGLKAAVSAALGCENVRTFDFKWLRAVPKGTFSGAHVDWVYMGHGSQQLVTCWVPIGDIPVEMGTLAVNEASHRLPSFEPLRQTYGKLDWERDHLDGSGWFTDDPAEVTGLFGGQWKTADFRAGDVLLFGMQTMHMSTTNTTDQVRISCDVRWQPAADPIDSRYVGNPNEKEVKVKVGVEGVNKLTEPQPDGKDAAAAAGDEASVTIQQLRQRWGFSVREGHEFK